MCIRDRYDPNVPRIPAACISTYDVPTGGPPENSKRTAPPRVVVPDMFSRLFAPDGSPRKQVNEPSSSPSEPLICNVPNGLATRPGASVPELEVGPSVPSPDNAPAGPMIVFQLSLPVSTTAPAVTEVF